MKARITSADHVWPYKRDDKLLRVRVDFFPDPGDPLFDGCHVQVPERPLTEEEQTLYGLCRMDANPEACRDKALAQWGIAKVWRVNPINCHFFYLPVGFTQDDLDKAIQERMVGLKANMAARAASGHSDISIDDMPKSLLRATKPPKGEGQALIPTLEKTWTPALVAQVGAMLVDREVQEVKL